MDAPQEPKPVEINHWLPYWAVFMMDVRQTMRSWLYRAWVMISLVGALGYLLYRYGVYRESGIIQSGSVFMSDILRWTVLGSVTLIILLTAGCISSERGTLADSVLSRGISRHHYYLGKWHARLVIVLGTYFLLGALALVGGHFLLHEDLTLMGSVIALVTVSLLMATVITCGVAVSAMANTTVVGISVLWIVVYGTGFTLSLLPGSAPSPDRTLRNLPNVLRGQYDLTALGQMAVAATVVCLIAALVGMITFSRKDV